MWAVIILPGISIGALLFWWVVLTISDVGLPKWGQAKADRLADEAASRREKERLIAFHEQWAQDRVAFAERQRLASLSASESPSSPTSGA